MKNGSRLPPEIRSDRPEVRKDSVVPSALDLLDQPYTFTQLPLMLAPALRGAASDRGVQVTDAQLEGLHRLRFLVPLFRVRRDGRAIARVARSQPMVAHQLAHWEPTTRRDLLEARDEARLTLAGAEPFVSTKRRERRLNDLPYRTSDYLYSPYQLLALPLIRSVLPHLTYDRAGAVVGMKVNSFWRRFALSRARQLNDLVVPLAALEPVYYGSIIGRLTLGSAEGFEAYDHWRRAFQGAAMLAWLDVGSDRLVEMGDWLLHEADGIDPLRDWTRLVREADPELWMKLRGDARTAVDYRIAAELMLRCHDDLGRDGDSTAVTTPGPTEAARDNLRRLKPRGGIDATLTEFGLSPHPSLLLVLEGDTELLLFPRVMELFGIRTDPEYISIQSAGGVGRDLTALVRYAIAPRVEPDQSGRFLRLDRPLTRILVVTDPEGPMKTAKQRRARQRDWILRLLLTLPREHRTLAVKDAIKQLVHTMSWGRRGLSFEFAHFTDRQIALAIAEIQTPARRIPLAELTRRVGSVRGSNGNLKTLLGRTSKLYLADALWPTLEKKIQVAQRRATVDRIPIVRVLDRATALAREFPRHSLVVPTGKT